LSLKVNRQIMDQVTQAAEAAHPEECCGLLIGPVPKDFHVPGRAVRVEEARPLPNGWDSAARTHRYSVDPKLLMTVEKELAGTGRGVVGFYHSHPDVPAWPSPFDLMRAWPCYSYWIVRVDAGKAVSSRSWMRSEDGENFVEETLS
jgi:proteasome lid subunit RPN8/RPN11